MNCFAKEWDIFQMFLPSRKVIYDVHTTFSGTMLILFVEAFMKILKLTFSKQISLHNWILIALFLLFGINVILVYIIEAKRGSSLL